MALRLGVLVFFVSSLLAAEDYYHFNLDQDRVSGAPDFSFLNQPLSAADRVFVRDGHFYRVGADLQPNTGDDARVRFYGVNLAFNGNFPEIKDAERVAKRLRRLGVNLVRLHHMDSSPDATPEATRSLLTTGPYPTLNPVSVERLRRFLDALKAEGIYANLNLLVGYNYRPGADGVPAVPGSEPMPNQSKPLKTLHPRMIELGKQFTARVIEALGLKDDPVLAMVEITNESSIIYSFQTGALDRLTAGEYGTVLHEYWNGYLTAKYGETQALREAWGATTPDGAQILQRDRWQMELAPGAAATVKVMETEGEPALEVDIAQTASRTICKQVGFSVDYGTRYKAEFEIRADLPDGVTRNFNWDMKQDVSPWRTMISRTYAISNRWQKQTITFDAPFGMEGIGRFGFYLESVTGKVWIRRWSLRPAGLQGLGANEALERGNVETVKLDSSTTQPRLEDYILFLTDRDRHAMREFLGVVREKLGPLAPVAGTQMGFGGLMLLDSQQDLDYQDNHFYVDHYTFPNVSWDGRDWLMRDTSSLGAGLTSFMRMAATSEAGRPFTVSEYNQPWPNRHAAEIDPTLAIFGAFQDWDSIMHFAYSHGRNWDDNVPNGFNLNGDWSKWVNNGQAAWLFRSGAVQPGRDPLEIQVPLAMRLRATRERRNGNVNDFLQAASGYNPMVALLHPVRISRSEDGIVPESAALATGDVIISDTGEVTYNRASRLFLLHSPWAAGVFGFVGKEKVQAGVMSVELAPSARGFAALLLTPADGAVPAESKRLLLTNPGYTLRTQPGSDPPRPQQIVAYPGQSNAFTLEREPSQPNKPSGNLNGGNVPVWMERVEAVVTLRIGGAKLVVFPLDGNGSRLTALAASDVTNIDGGFRVHLQAEGQAWSPWYEVVVER